MFTGAALVLGVVEAAGVGLGGGTGVDPVQADAMRQLANKAGCGDLADTLVRLAQLAWTGHGPHEGASGTF